VTPRPNFVIAGAARSGTTALALALGRHPEVFVAGRKEASYFLFRTRDWGFSGPGDGYLLRGAVRSEAEYRAMFAETPRAARAVGEASVYYLAEPWVFAEIADTLDRPRLLFVLRAPAERAFSAWAHMVRDGRETLPFDEALVAEPARVRAGWEWSWHYRGLSRYRDGIAAAIAAVGPERVLVLRHEDLLEAPRAALRRCFEFLGVDPAAGPARLPRVNGSGRSRHPWLTRVLLGAGGPGPGVRRLVPASLRRSAFLRLQRWNTDPMAPPPEILAQLAVELDAEVAAIAALTGLDLDRWRARRATGDTAGTRG
jgi:hypothetical protein